MHSLAGLCAVLFMLATGVTAAAENDPAAPFGKPVLYRPDDEPKGLVLMLSDQGGWNTAASDFAKTVTAEAYVVAGLDWPAYLQRVAASGQACAPVVADLLRLAQQLQQHYGIAADKRPLLVGLGAGGVAAYRALTASAADSFHAALSVDFCPPVALTPPLCAAPGVAAADMAPVPNLKTPWFVFQREAAQSCPLETVQAFVNQVQTARFTVTPATAAEASPETRFAEVLAVLQWLDPGIQRQAQSTQEVAGVPLVEAPVAAAANDTLALFLSGDGGWAELDKGVTAELVTHGISTVGWDSLSYYWKPRQPAEVANDLTRVLRHYLELWHKQRIILIGYSFGADVLPAIVNRLPPDLRDRVALVALLGLGKTASFEFHLTNWLGDEDEGAFPIAPELLKLRDKRVLCVYGEDDAGDSLCPSQPPVSVVKLSGDHHFDDDYAAVAGHILKALSSGP